MKFGKAIMVALALSGLQVSCGSDTSTESSLSSTRVREVCSRRDIPSNWVVIKRLFTLNCPGRNVTSDNTYKITEPSDGLLVCSSSDVPDGYLKGRSKYTLDCGNGSIFVDNAFYIEKL